MGKYIPASPRKGWRWNCFAFSVVHVPSGQCHLGSAAPVPRLVEPWAQAVPWRSSCRHSSAGVRLSVAGSLLAVSDVRLLPGHGVAQGQHRNRLGRQGWLSAAAAAAAGLWGHGFLRLSCCFQLEVCQGNSHR